MKLTFAYDLKLNKIQEKIIKELKWHSSKVYNMLNFAVKEGKEDINPRGILNVESSKIYKKYRKENWHSEYLHSHTLQQIILNYMSDYKSYAEISKMYKEKDKGIKGKPKIIGVILYRKRKKESYRFTFSNDLKIKFSPLNSK